jgi:hypothetical protein
MSSTQDDMIEKHEGTNASSTIPWKITQGKSAHAAFKSFCSG